MVYRDRIDFLSGSGKTALACALLAALQKRGLAPCAFKCGPDYIDPMFHRSVLGVESHNLDLFLCGEDAARTLYARHAAGHGAAVVEGVMGFYDGVGGVTARASAWHVARTLDLPVLLVLRPRGASLTLAAQVRGLLAFRQPSHIAGILLNDCSAMLAQSLAPMLEQETGVPVLGYLPHMPEAVFGSRHLGLYTAAEIDGLAARIGALAAQLEQSVDMPRLLALCGRRTADGAGRERKAPARKQAARIAVARDEAFCFAYAETLESLRDAGAELVFFSPVHDAALPGGAGGLYLPGGYPELYAGQLSQNAAMRRAVRRAVEAGLPTVAECGGFLYLQQSLADRTGNDFPMAGALPGKGQMTDRLVRFGYVDLLSRREQMICPAGGQIRGHSFHYSDTTKNGESFLARKRKDEYFCVQAGPRLYAGYPHLYFWSNPDAASRFLAQCATYQKEQKV